MPSIPKVIVFDLDGCVWYPEMYHLWGNGGSPFTLLGNGNVRDRDGTEVELMGDVRDIMRELKTDPKWKNTTVAVASCCDEPSWARECIEKIVIEENVRLQDVFDDKVVEIYKRSKSHHLKAISKKTGVALNEMMFLDNESGNCNTVAELGVTVVFTPEGVTREVFEQALTQYPAPGEILGSKKRRYR